MNFMNLNPFGFQPSQNMAQPIAKPGQPLNGQFMNSNFMDSGAANISPITEAVVTDAGAWKAPTPGQITDVFADALKARGKAQPLQQVSLRPNINQILQQVLSSEPGRQI